jgi:hypothetical protein
MTPNIKSKARFFADLGGSAQNYGGKGGGKNPTFARFAGTNMGHPSRMGSEWRRERIKLKYKLMT